MRRGVTAIRTWLAQLVWLVAVGCALLLALGALCIALGANQGNALVGAIIDGADAVALGVFSRDNGIFTFEGADAATKNALANWGLGAIAYLVAGRALARLVRP